MSTLDDLQAVVDAAKRLRENYFEDCVIDDFDETFAALAEDWRERLEARGES